MDSSELSALIDAFADRTVAVIGDVVADEFVYGSVARVSREAPVLILEYDSTEIVPGAGANAANNVAALGGRASLVSIVGSDEAGRRTREVLRHHRRLPVERSPRRESSPGESTPPSSRWSASTKASVARSTHVHVPVSNTRRWRASLMRMPC